MNKTTNDELIAAYLAEYRRTTGNDDLSVFYKKGFFYLTRGQGKYI